MQRTNNATTPHIGIYSILCKYFDKHYIGETQRNLEKIKYEYKLSIRLKDDKMPFGPKC